jgi:hypothetical protein
MVSDAPSTPLTARALERLQKLAEGNGLAPDAIKLLGADEKIWALEGLMKLEPVAEAQVAHYAGSVRGLGRKVMRDTAALREEVERRQKEFREGADWLPAAVKQLKEQPGEGWGLDDVRIALPDRSATFAASEICPSCQGSKMLVCQSCSGQGTVLCNHCNGSRQEFCYNCAGRGVNPANPDQPCVICNGRRYIPCRFCRATGQMSCPACHGRRGTACTACKGAGSMTQEVALTCSARTHFTIASNIDFPSGLRRGLDRVGIANLPNGYADIETFQPKPVEDDDSLAIPPPRMGTGHEGPEDAKAKAPKPEIHYRAQLPYADLRMSFAGKPALVSAFGKRGALIGVPAFLDAALEPWREKLKSAAKGDSDIEDALGARVMRDALTLQLSGKSDVRELRRLYPLGLSAETAQEIMSNMRLALNRFTLRTRALTAVLCGLVSGVLFGGIFLTPVHALGMEGLPALVGLAADAIVLCIILGLSWFALSSSISLALRKRFPGLQIPLIQKIGKTGLTMLGVIVLLFIAAVLFAPVRPEWLALLFKV